MIIVSDETDSDLAGYRIPNNRLTHKSDGRISGRTIQQGDFFIIDGGVQELQAALFPVEVPKGTGSFLANFLLKSDQVESEEGDDGKVPKVKEIPSRELPTSQFVPQAPRWPTECQVLEERVVHIPYTPSIPEPYYVPTGREVQPKPVGDDCGIIVYQYYPISAVNYFSRSSIGGSKYLLPTCPSPEEDSLHFESRFESGNLAKAIRITSSYYELYLRTDLYTNRHMQWFYFRITNMKKNFMYRFSIVNLFKDGSLYNEGMKPLMYSTKDSKLHSIGWRRCGDNITYFCNDSGSADDSDSNMMYTLTFTLEFPHDGDAVYLAHSYPYTYTDLQDYLVEMSSHPIKSTFSTLRLLCKTIAGNNVYFVTITSPQEPGDFKKKKAVVITARVHPGETPSSWMMKGMLDFLTSDCGPAKELRDNFIFKIVPMLNPDGVIVGNNRCSLNGRDLNRQYRTVIKESYPSIWYTKLMIRRLLEECSVAMYCDLHAHSRKHNIFIYGCENRRDVDKHLTEQVFPLMLHKNSADKFSFENCKFHIHKCKEGTGRVVMWMMGIANSYTMEASFGGSTIGSRAETHFSPQDYEQMGRTFCQTLLDYFDEDPRKERLRVKIISRLVSEGSNAEEPTNIRLSDYSSDVGDTSSSSDEGRDKEEDYMVPFLVPPPSPNPPKKQLKPKMLQSKSKILQRSPAASASRKPLPLYTTTVGVDNLRSKSEYLSETSPDSDSDSDYALQQKIKRAFRRRRKRKSAGKKNLVAERSDSEIRPMKSLSVFDLVPPKNLRSLSWDRLSGVSQPKHMVDNRKSVVQQLSEVQTKLHTLKKNRVWLGVGGGDVNAPLSWGSNHSAYLTKPSSAPNENRSCNKHIRKKSSKHEKLEKKCPKKKHKEETKEKIQKKTQSGQQKKQFAEWIRTDEIKLQKSKSLPSTTTIQRQKTVKSDEENTKAKKKKKRQRTATKKQSKLKTVFKKRLRKTALDVITIRS